MITKNVTWHLVRTPDAHLTLWHLVTLLKNGFTDIRWIHSITRKKEKFDWRKWQLDYLFWKTSLLLIVTYWKFLSRVREANPNSTEKELKRLKVQTKHEKTENESKLSTQGWSINDVMNILWMHEPPLRVMLKK